MKNVLSFLILAGSLCFGQEINDTINANNISVNLDPFNNGSNGQNSTFEFPKESGLKTITSSWIWISGKANDKNFISAETNDHSGSDFQPGPFSTTGEYDGTVQTWRITIDMIQNHIYNTSTNNPNYIIPAEILTWPAHGDLSKGQAYYLAPFVDTNGNGFYDPQNGDYPKVKGKECFYYIMNDDVAHGETGSSSLGLEIHCMFYQFITNTFLNNTIFADVTVYNRSEISYTDGQFSVFTDFGIGNINDDFAGVNPSQNYFYGYNLSNGDNLYGDLPPVQMVTILNTPLDQANKLNGFVVYENHDNLYGKPEAANEYYHLNHSKWNDGSDITYGGNGHNGSEPTSFMYSVDNDFSNSWLMSNENQATNVRSLGNIGPFDIESGSKLKFEFAYFTDFPTDNNPEHQINFLNEANQEITLYYNTIIATDVEELQTEQASFQFFPNPADHTIELRSETPGNVQIFDSVGRNIKTFNQTQNQTIDISKLPAGNYWIRYTNKLGSTTQKLLVI